MSEIKGLALSLDDMIKARQSEQKEASKKAKEKKRTPIKSTPKKKSQHDSAKKAIGSGKAKRNANAAARRGITAGAGTGGAISHKVYVGNLSWETSWQDLKDYMNEQIHPGSVRHADVMKGPDGRSKGYGIVEFTSVKDAKEACRKLNDSEFMGRTIYVREDREEGGGGNASASGGGGGGGRSSSSGLSVFVGNLPFDVSWQDLKDFMRAAGNVDKANILEGPDGRSKGCGIVTFQHPKDAQRAIRQLNDSMFRGRPIQVREDREEDTGGRGKFSTPPPGLSVFVGNLPFDIRWQELKDHMRRAGNVDKANVMETPDGRSKGCAIVVYQHPKDAQRAIRELTGTTLGGREIFVKEDQRP